MASIGLTQEQPEERIGSEKDPRWFCPMITIRSLNNCRMIRCIISALCPGVQIQRHESVRMCIFNVSITEVHVTVLPPGVSCRINVKIFRIHSNGSCILLFTWFHPGLSPGQFLKKRFFQDRMDWSQTTSTRQSQQITWKNPGKLTMTRENQPFEEWLKNVIFHCRVSFRWGWILKFQHPNLESQIHGAKSKEFQIVEPD